jgi:DNA primase
MCLCVFHDDHDASLQFNLDKGLFVCFSCNTGGSIKKLERHFGISSASTVGVGLDVIYRKLNDLRKGADLDTGPVIKSENELIRYRVPSKHWADRGLKPATVDAFDLGYDLFAHAQTIPVRTMNGELLGVVRRFLDPDADPRYKYPKGFHKAQHLFGSWMVAADSFSGPVALTEGAIDAMTLWQYGIPAMAIYGSHVSDAQIRIMRRLGLHELVLFFDNDKAGMNIVRQCRGWKQQGNGKWERHDELDLRRFFAVRTVSWRGISALEAKDANDLNLIQARNLVANALPLG